MSGDLELLQRTLAGVLMAEDAIEALKHARQDEQLPASVRENLSHADEDGVAMAALLIARLRFERAVQGSRLLSEWFERAPAECTEAFRKYHREVPPTSIFPGLEGRAFEEWMRAGPS